MKKVCKCKLEFMCSSISVGAKIVNLENNKNYSVQQHLSFQQFNFSYPLALCFLKLISGVRIFAFCFIISYLSKFCVHFLLERKD